MRILEKIATLEEPRAGHIAKVLRRDLPRVKTHLHVLETLFAIHALEPHPSGTGKTLYFICDVGLARILGASFERRIHTWALHEQLSQRAYRDDREHRLSFYRTSKGRLIHLVIEGMGGLARSRSYLTKRFVCATLKYCKRSGRRTPETPCVYTP